MSDYIHWQAHSPKPRIIIGFAHHKAIDQRQVVIVEGFEIETAAVGCATRPSVAPHGLEEAPRGECQWRVVGHKFWGFAISAAEPVADIVQGDHIIGFGMAGAAVTSTSGWAWSRNWKVPARVAMGR